MRKTVLMLCVLGVLVAAAAGAGFAMPSLGGPTGIVSVPTAQVLPLNEVEAALSYQIVKLNALYGPDETAELAAPLQAASLSDALTANRLRVLALQGLAGISNGTEGWASFATVRGGKRENVWGLGAKALLTTKFMKGAKSPVLAVGASYQQWENVGSVDKLYLTATADLRTMSKPLQAQSTGIPLYGTLGLLYLRANPDGGSSDSLLRPFLGLEAGIAEDTKLGAEFRFSDNSIDDRTVWSFVLRHVFDQTFSAEIGTTNASPVGTGMDHQGMFVRVGYHLTD
jgi:hypothetical protein